MTNNITKKEIGFWITIIGIIVAGVVALNTLKMRVDAMYDKGGVLRSDFEKAIESIDKRLDLLEEIKIDIAEMKVDIKYLKNNR